MSLKAKHPKIRLGFFCESWWLRGGIESPTTGF